MRGSRETLSSTGWRKPRGLASSTVLRSVDLVTASGQARPPASQRLRSSGHSTRHRRAVRRPMGAEMVPDLGDSARKVKIPCIRTQHPSYLRPIRCDSVYRINTFLRGCPPIILTPARPLLKLLCLACSGQPYPLRVAPSLFGHLNDVISPQDTLRTKAAKQR